MIFVGSLWDVLSLWSLQEAGGVGWVLGLLCLIGLSKLFENTSRARCLNRVICIQIWLLCLYIASCLFTGGCSKCVVSARGRWCRMGAGCALFQRNVRASCLNSVICIQIWLLCLYVDSCLFTG